MVADKILVLGAIKNSDKFNNKLQELYFNMKDIELENKYLKASNDNLKRRNKYLEFENKHLENIIKNKVEEF